LAPSARLAPLAPFAAYLLLAAAWAWPLPLHLASRFAHDPGDPLLNTFILWWDAHTIPLSNAMWSAPFYWPSRDALALTEHLTGIALITSPIQWLGGSALLAYNVILIASTWFAGLSAHALVRRLSHSDAGAYCAGLAFAFAPYRASQLAHVQVLVTWWMPLALLALHAYVSDGRRRWLALFGASWLMQSLSNGYYMFFFPVLIGCWLLFFMHRRDHWRRAAAVAGTWIVFSLPLLPVVVKYYDTQHRLGLFRTRTEMQLFSGGWPSFAQASPLLRFWPSPHEVRTTEDYLFPGLTCVALLLAAGAARLGSGLRVRQSGANADLTPGLAFYTAAAVLTAWMATGPALEQRSLATLWHAYGWVAWIPGYEGLRVPARFFMMTTLCLAIAAGLAVAALATSRKRAMVIGGIAAAGLLVDGWIVEMPLGAPPRPFGVEIARGARVLELPVEDDAVNVAAMYRATQHRALLVNGYAGYVPPTANIVDWALHRKDPSILTALRRGHPLYVAVANHQASAEWTAFMDAQHDAQMVGVSGAGRLYLMPAAGFPPQVDVGGAIPPARGEGADGWLTFDLGSAHSLRALDVATRGHVVLLRETVRVETSADGVSWTLAADLPPGEAALAGVLAEPLRVPVRVLLPDVTARYVRVNAPAFQPGAVTIYGH